MIYLKDLRNTKGVSQQNIADFLGISRQAYSNYENGNREPDFETLLKLGEYFECSVDSILRGKEKENSNSTVSDSDIKAAFWGGEKDLSDAEIEALWQDVKDYAKFKTEQKKKKESNGSH